ncbi:Sugar-specific transcriptional regulator TrmB [Halogranum gelatinilyticum]|uniref:Sugar-specific transcriptional regulator TrmB n=1 Tax=Halogranum gelatinilyticum TaxID=660521 RepID=A0A1G9PQG3_9EURY|nr:TrmB family transcriptional regulator [Halogranum gelatinilyticum]SDM01056.1 Sugar-specific transcriptional regulator TrmB [Halogranum gelatinilyticum]
MSQHGEQDDAMLREELGDFGFSDKEIDVYLALLSLGEATTSTISEEADVSQQAVYTITDRLEDRGLVRVNDHASPKTIRAVPPEESMAALSSRIDSITPVLKTRFNDTKPQTPELKMVKSHETALKRLREAISQAQREVIVAIPERIYPEIEQELQAARERDVLVFLLVQDVEDFEEAEERFSGVADVVRCWSENILFMFATDTQSTNPSVHQSALVGDALLLSGTHDVGDGVAVSEKHLAGSIHGMFFSAYWPAGTEVFVTDPDPLPETYDWFRQAVFQARLHLNAGADLLADVETKEGEIVSGKVSQVRQALVDPATNEYTLQTSLFLETDEGEVSVGGQSAILEDYEASSVTLRVE